MSLASSIPVLGLERVCPRKGCPWPRIFFVSLALASSLVSSTSPLVKINILIFGCLLNSQYFCRFIFSMFIFAGLSLHVYFCMFILHVYFSMFIFACLFLPVYFCMFIFCRFSSCLWTILASLVHVHK